MSDEDGDPFEQFEDVSDREGDPFDALEGPDDTDGTERDTEHANGVDSGDEDSRQSREPSTDPPGGTDPSPGVEVDTAASVAPADGDDPFWEMGDREGDPFESAESAFERMDVGDVDPDAVWETLTDAEQRGSVSKSQDHVYAEVSKHGYCEQCEHFSAPPEVSCTHEGTEILEFVDLETVRVVDCPVVAERRELESDQ